MYHPQINKEDPKPIYLQIKDWFLAAIEQGRLQPGQKIPSTRELCEQLGVSRMTVLQALRELHNQGRLFTVSGKGTFVRKPEKLETNLRVVWGFTETFQAQGFRVGAQVIHAEVIPAEESEAEALQTPAGTPLFHLVRRRLLDEQPVGVESTLLVRERFPGLESIDWNSASLYSVLRERYNTQPLRGCNYIEAAAADESVARLLSIPKNTPILSTERISCLENMIPVEHVHAFYRADFLRLKVDMTPENTANILTSKLQPASPILSQAPAG